jgi:hypothetical protein
MRYVVPKSGLAFLFSDHGLIFFAGEDARKGETQYVKNSFVAIRIDEHQLPNTLY